jgi:hypothetical protein
MSMADEHLQQHPVAKIESEIGQLIESAITNLYQAYQLTGKIEFEKP